MFVLGGSVQVDAYRLHVISDAFKLPIHEDVSYFETSSMLCIDDLLK